MYTSKGEGDTTAGLILTLFYPVLLVFVLQLRRSEPHKREATSGHVSYHSVSTVRFRMMFIAGRERKLWV